MEDNKIKNTYIYIYKSKLNFGLSNKLSIVKKHELTKGKFEDEFH